MNALFSNELISISYATQGERPAGYVRNPRLIAKIMTEEKLGVEGRRPEKTMNLPQTEISWGWGQKCATDARPLMEIPPD